LRRVFQRNRSNQVVVYGLLPTTPSFLIAPATGTLAFTALNPQSENIFVSPIHGYTGKVNLSLTGVPAGMTYSFTPATVSVTSAKSVTSSLSLSPAGAVLPLNDNYTVLVQATDSSGATSYAPIRLLMRSATFTSVTKVGCNSSNQMNVSLSWQINGSSVPSLWIQDGASPAFPGRLWIEPVAASGTMQTGYIVNNKQGSFVWLIDQSAGIPANFDNALKYANLGFIYRCP
jgi:hypothetical protein